MSQRINWTLVVSVFGLLLMILGTVWGHALMTEQRLAALEAQMRVCVAK